MMFATITKAISAAAEMASWRCAKGKRTPSTARSIVRMIRNAKRERGILAVLLAHTSGYDARGTLRK